MSGVTPIEKDHKVRQVTDFTPPNLANITEEEVCSFDDITYSTHTTHFKKYLEIWKDTLDQNGYYWE